MYNQHFNRKNIEAAIRVALANKDQTIAINGKRSKVVFKVSYNWLFDTVSLVAETKGQQMLTYVDVKNLTRNQLAKDSAVKLITEHFDKKIKEYKAAA